MRRFCLLFTLMGCVLSVNSENTTQQKYLSGTGLGDTKNWAFFCTGGSNSNKWDSIAVPSQWELEGYGDYTYGRWYTISKETQPSMEEGFYKTSFTIPT